MVMASLVLGRGGDGGVSALSRFGRKSPREILTFLCRAIKTSMSAKV